MYTHIPLSLLEPYKEVLKSLTEWDRSKQPEFWSQKRIDGEMMYKIHRHSARIVEETGLSVNRLYTIIIMFQTRCFHFIIK